MKVYNLLSQRKVTDASTDFILYRFKPENVSEKELTTIDIRDVNINADRLAGAEISDCKSFDEAKKLYLLDEKTMKNFYD